MVCGETTTTETVDGNLDIATNLGGLVSREGVVTTAAAGYVTYVGESGTTTITTAGAIIVEGSVGILQASGPITGAVLAQTGSVGATNTNSILSLSAQAGIYSDSSDIGTCEAPFVIQANGGVQLDPYSLSYENVVLGDVLNGVGTIFSPLGNIYVDITTGGSVGTLSGANDSPTQVIGGISAPLGTVDATLMVGGNVGGIYGQTVDTNYYGQSVILGSIGILRNATSDSSGSVQGVDVNNPLIIQTTDSNNDLVDYIVEVDSGTAAVDYTVNSDGTVCFDSITYTAGSSGEYGTTAGIHILTRTGQRTAGGISAMGPSSVQTEVDDLVVDGNVANIEVDGSLDNLTVNGNLASGSSESPGELFVESSLGNVTITGNLGSSTSTLNPFVAADETIQVGAGEFGCMTVDGTNYGLVNTTLTSGQWLTWANTLRTPTEAAVAGDGYITVALLSGSANLTINNGYLQEVAVKGTASGLEVLTSDTQYASPGSASATSVALAIKADHALLVAGTITPAQYVSDVVAVEKTAATLRAQAGVIAQPMDATANVGTIEENGTGVLNLIGLNVQGGVQNIEGQAGRSLIYNVLIDGNVGCVTGGTIENFYIGGSLDSMTGRIIYKGTVVGCVDDTIAATVEAISLNLEGNAGVVDGGGILENVVVGGNADVIKATGNVINIAVKGNAGIITSGNALSKITVGGSSLSVGARVMSNVQITGSVGLGVDKSDDVVLGNAFCEYEAADLLGLNADNLYQAGTVGPNCVSYLGGLEANIASNVSVGGSISDLLISQLSSGSSALFNSTANNGIMYVPRGVFVKQDGVTVQIPGQPLTTTLNINLDIADLKKLLASL